jgi:hypothetical protein
MERITAVEEVRDVSPDGDRFGGYDGFRVTTDAQVVDMLIANGQICCEEWGYFVTEDEPAKFIGTELRGVEIVAPDLTVKGLPEYGLEDGAARFVNVNTSAGTLQFVAYNAHNGYYGHTAIVRSAQLQHEEVL